MVQGYIYLEFYINLVFLKDLKDENVYLVNDLLKKCPNLVNLKSNMVINSLRALNLYYIYYILSSDCLRT